MYRQYINGDLILGKGRKLDVINPANEEIVDTIDSADAQQAQEALVAAKEAFKTWSKTSLNERQTWIDRILDAIESNRDKLIELLYLETGKPFNQTTPDMKMLVGSLKYSMEEARRITGETIQDENSGVGTYHLCERRPVGVVVAHLAWNFPLLNVGYKVAPAIASGCTTVIKPSSYTPLATMYFGELLHSIGFPKGVINILAGPSGDISKVLNSSTIPRKVSLIGSSATGIRLMKEAATSIKQFSLELGGNGAAIVLGDADLDASSRYITSLKTFNGGQVCTNINRAFVHDSVYVKFAESCKAYFAKSVLGSGMDEGATQGPMITKSDQLRMVALVDDAVAKGAKVAFGGKIPVDKPKGYYFEPTLLLDVTDDMRVCREEIFGPILPMLRFTNIDDAVARANDTDYGLTSYIYTKNLANAFQGAETLESGTVFVNVAPGGDTGMPYPNAGIKNSGIGCNRSKYSLEEYYYIKHISLSPNG